MTQFISFTRRDISFLRYTCGIRFWKFRKR